MTPLSKGPASGYADQTQIQKHGWHSSRFVTMALTKAPSFRRSSSVCWARRSPCLSSATAFRWSLNHFGSQINTVSPLMPSSIPCYSRKFCSTRRGHALRQRHIRYCVGSELCAQRVRVSISHPTAWSNVEAVYSENRDKIEVYLAFGASRFEASKRVAVEALRLALTPMINQMRYVDHDFCVPRPPLTTP